MVGQQSALDVAAGNIANATTPGFRADRALFRQTLVAANNRAVPTQSLRYSVVRTVEPDRRQVAPHAHGVVLRCHRDARVRTTAALPAFDPSPVGARGPHDDGHCAGLAVIDATHMSTRVGSLAWRIVKLVYLPMSPGLVTRITSTAPARSDRLKRRKATSTTEDFLAFSLTTRDEQRSVFSLGILEDRMFLMCTGGSLAAILFGTELGIFHRILGTVPLTLHQWLVCIVVALAIIPVSEARRLLLLRRAQAAAPSGDAADAAS